VLNVSLVVNFYNVNDRLSPCFWGDWLDLSRGFYVFVGGYEMSIHEFFMEFIDLKCVENEISRQELSTRLGWHKSAISRLHNNEMPYGVSLKNAYLLVIAAESNFFEFFVFMDKKLLDQKKRKG
jgi:hypothetical protein